MEEIISCIKKNLFQEISKSGKHGNNHIFEQGNAEQGEEKQKISEQQKKKKRRVAIAGET